MRLNILSQIIDAYHDFVTNDTENYRNDFEANYSEVEDPVGGFDGVTTYDKYNVDQDAD